jgi:hypothetical protein
LDVQALGPIHPKNCGGLMSIQKMSVHRISSRMARKAVGSYLIVHHGYLANVRFQAMIAMFEP